MIYCCGVLCITGNVAVSMASTHKMPGGPHPWSRTKYLQVLLNIPGGQREERIVPAWEPLLQRRSDLYLVKRWLFHSNCTNQLIHTGGSKIYSLLRGRGYMSCPSFHHSPTKKENTLFRKFLRVSFSGCHLLLRCPGFLPEEICITAIRRETPFPTWCLRSLPWLRSSEGQTLVTDQDRKLSRLHPLKGPPRWSVGSHADINKISHNSASSWMWLFSLWSL